MNRRLIYIAILAAPLSAAGQESFGTLAAGEGLGYGATVNHPTQAEADTAALDECRARDTGCEILDRFGDGMCFAVAISEPVEVLGWAVAPERQQGPRTGAQQHCVDSGGGRACRVADADCNGASANLAPAAGSNGATVDADAPGTPQQIPSQVLAGARCDEDFSGFRDCWAEIPGHGDCYAWFARSHEIRGQTVLSAFEPIYGIPLAYWIWEGQCLNGLAHGHWVLTGDGPTYTETVQGPFVEGKRQGYWEEREVFPATETEPEKFYNLEATFENGRLHGIRRENSNVFGYLRCRETFYVNGNKEDREERNCL